ncbi:MAG: AraC family transcriptional regulator [Hydrocarboniphaga sp.]|uniref:AraC family transcriptional regulator n=1 Tax=Hydrocarboniphaga sp. TaxID=2033016 RepID=UPI002634178E|nr:AraC family transcriptional regulator [Hydrocarboniphaga sp.]MDB5971925.1 AraC family transcriptional regulator [Hydrocarboniphaga sp.]
MRDSGQLLQVVHQGMVKAGLDVAAIYQRLGYDAEKLALRELRTPHQQQVFFWSTIESVTKDPEIGLHLCPHLPIFRGEVLEYLMFSSRTFGEGLNRSLKYLRLISDAINVRLDQDARGVRVAVVGTAMDAPQLRHTEICVVYELMRFAGAVTEHRFRPQRVLLRCSQRAPQAEYDKIFGCSVEFGGRESEIWFDPAMLDYRSPHSDPDLLLLHEGLAEKRLLKLKREDLVERIRGVFAQRLELENCDLEDVAKELDIPPRRLRFELARAGTSFSQILADFRFHLAKRLLAKTDEAIENIVYLTGFSEPSTFYRAFKRWSGQTPVQYRESRRARRAGAAAQTVADSK